MALVGTGKADGTFSHARAHRFPTPNRNRFVEGEDLWTLLILDGSNHFQSALKKVEKR